MTNQTKTTMYPYILWTGSSFRCRRGDINLRKKEQEELERMWRVDASEVPGMMGALRSVTSRLRGKTPQT